MPSKVIRLAFVLASVFALSAALQCYETPIGGNNQPTSDNYTAVNCTGDKYCIKWTSKDIKYTTRGCGMALQNMIIQETGGHKDAVPDCNKADSTSHTYNYDDKHQGAVYCCKKDLCNVAAFSAPTFVTLVLGVLAAVCAKV